MARKRKGLAIHGWLNLDKPAGLSSSAAVGRVRRIFNAAKVGHGGTLDPAATGVLPIAFGAATKLSTYAMNGLKTYRFTVRWGVATSTDDVEGRVTARHDHRPDAAAIERALPAFRGLIEQTPPIFSAIKVKGRRAYELARKDIPVSLPSREVCPIRTMPSFWWSRARGLMCVPWPAIWPWPWAPSGMCPHCAAPPSDRFWKKTQIHWINLKRWGILRSIRTCCFPLRPCWTTSRLWP
jgi:tRNA pseudouridine(55) synthase